MAPNKKNNKTPKTKFLLFDESGKYEGSFNNLGDAQDCVDRNEMDGAHILEVIRVWEAAYPPEPEIEFGELNIMDFEL